MTGDNAIHAEGMMQVTLEGEEMDIKHVECEMYPVCTSPAEYEVETLVYDGTAQVYRELPACGSCASELTEPEPPSESDNARELSRCERLVGGKNEQ